MILDMFAYYNMVKEHDINIIYSGPVWADGIESIAGTLRKRLEFDELPLSASQSVFSVFVEQMNNMLMYSAEKGHYAGTKHTHDAGHTDHVSHVGLDMSCGVFILGVRKKMYFIQSGNVINNDRVPLIKERIDYLNTLDKNALRKYYREQIRSENTDPDSKGAGLGLIEIARRANSPIEYTFNPFGEGQSFFSMFVTIGNGGN